MTVKSKELILRLLRAQLENANASARSFAAELQRTRPAGDNARAWYADRLRHHQLRAVAAQDAIDQVNAIETS